MFIALQKIKDIKKGFIVILLPDNGGKYLSMDLF